MYLYIIELLGCTPETNIANQLHFNKKLNLKQKQK